MTCKLAGEFDEALLHFEKLNTIVQDDPRVIFQIADMYDSSFGSGIIFSIYTIIRSFDKMKNPKQALEWYSRLVPLVPTDPGVLAHIADLYQRNNDKAQALHYYSEVTDPEYLYRHLNIPFDSLIAIIRPAWKYSDG